jgi:two-component system, NtrC family, response regulator PilR
MTNITGSYRLPQTVLIVDDEPDLCELLGITLQRMQVPSQAVHSLAAAREALATGQFALCLADLRLPDGDGLDLVAWIQEHHPGMPVAVITAHGNVESAVRALKLGAFDFLSKPLDLANLRRVVSQALRGAPRNISQRALLGDSAPMQALRTLVARVARSQAPVHISGESGSGKELVARLIHDSSPRRDGPFVAVNCGAIPTELLESELFGHKRGAFTGAVADHRGLVQSAEGGTLFLDEVADLPLHMQVKLLRVLQERSLRPVGETTELPVDVRWLSATHRDLTQAVALGQFREDLYYRINVIEVRVPALRERSEDLPELVEHIIGRLAAEQGRPSPALSREAEARLAAYAFPGNVRELENILERALAFSDGTEVLADDLQLRAIAVPPAAPGTGTPNGVAAATGTPPTASIPAPIANMPAQLADLERGAILQALEKSRWNRTAAARLLGISFRQLRYRIAKLGLDDEEPPSP